MQRLTFPFHVAGRNISCCWPMKNLFRNAANSNSYNVSFIRNIIPWDIRTHLQSAASKLIEEKTFGWLGKERKEKKKEKSMEDWNVNAVSFYNTKKKKIKN